MRTGGRWLRGAMIGLAACASGGVIAPAVAAADAGVDIAPVEGQQFSGRVLNTDCAFSSGRIDWGDGATPDGAQSDTNSVNAADGTHTYAEEGRYTGMITYTTSCSRFSQRTFTATVADAQLSASGQNVPGTQGQAFTDNVAHFADPDPNGTPGDYSISIDWGDGTASTGTATASGSGGFDVKGTHSYATVGSFTVTTSISDTGGSNASARSTAQVGPRAVFVVVHTQGVDQVTTTSARAFGTINDGGTSVPYHFEYGPSTTYGSRTPSGTTSGSATDQAVSAALAGLAPDTDYHVRLVADAPTGPVFGEDVAFHTARPGALPGLPPGLDFTWSPRADVLVAGAPLGGIRFLATPGAGVSYQWSFDSPPGAGFAPDPAASGDSPRHTFTADGAHDTDKAQGADGSRRRLYTVRLRATAASGASVEVAHDLVVVPNAPPLVDFTMDGAQNANAPTLLTPTVSDPAGSRVANHIDHIEWTLDTPSAAHPLGTAVDLICRPDGSGCRSAKDGGVPGPWFSQGDGHQAVVNFFQRGLAVHRLPELSTLNIDALPQTAADGTPLTGGLQVVDGTGLFTVFHDLRVAYLYDNATLLQQTSFAQDAGEATGAQLKSGASLSTNVTTSFARSPRLIKPIAYSPNLKSADPRLRLVNVLDGHELQWRQVTLTAVDTAGVRTSVTRSVPLRPVSAPDLRARFVDASAQVVPIRRRRPVPGAAARAHAAADIQTITHPLTTNDVLAFDASGTSDPSGKIAYYTLEVGKQQGCRAPDNRPQRGYAGLPVFNSVDPPVDGYRPGEFFGRPSDAGAGLGLVSGRTGNLASVAANPRNILNVGFGSGKALQARSAADQTGLPTLGEKLLRGPLIHPCAGGGPDGAFAHRNVFPSVFMVRSGQAARPPYGHLTGQLPTPRGLASQYEFATTALVTSDPSKLRFRIPVADTYSVTVAAYNEAGLGAIQRTDNIVIQNATSACDSVAGRVKLGGTKTLGFSGACAAVGGDERSLIWAAGDLTVNGVTIRPLDGAHLFVDTVRGQLFATRGDLPGTAPGALNGLSESAIRQLETNLSGQPAPVQIVFDRDPVARFENFGPDTVRGFFFGSQDPAVFAGATYHGSPVARADTGGPNPATFHIGFADATGDSTAAFMVELPKEFNSEGSAAGPTSPVQISAHTDVPHTDLATNHYASIARHHRSARPSGAVAGLPVARAAADEVSGTLSLDNQHLGPLTINSGTLTFDGAKGLWRGDIHDAYLEMWPQYKVSAHILIQNGALRELGGRVDGLDIPVFAGVFLNGVGFQIVTDPLTLSGDASFTALGGVLSGDLSMIIRTKPVFLRLEGRISVASIPLAQAFVQYDQANADTVSFGGHVGVDFGPVSMNASLNGAISGKTGDFFIEGDGELCVGICLNARALMSNVAVALCGGIHVGPLKLEAGAAYRFSPGKLEVFTGCDLNPYKPAIFRSNQVRGGGTAGRISLAAVDPLTVTPGTQEVSFRFHGDPSTVGAPSVKLISPTGRVYDTAPTAGDYVFAPPTAGAGGVSQIGGGLIDRDPVDHVTTAIIVNPPAGTWRVQTPPAQPPLTSVEVARGAHIPDNAFKGTVTHASVTASGAAVSTRAFTASLPPARMRILRALPRLERRRLVSARLTLPAGLTGELKLVDVGPTSSSPIQTVDLATSPRHLTIAFAPNDEPGKHQIQAIKYQQPARPGAAALPQRAFAVGEFVAPPVATPTAPALDVHRDAAGRLMVDVTPGDAGPLTTHATTFELVASTSTGQRIEDVFYDYRGLQARHYRRDLNRAKPLSKGRFRVTLAGIPRSATVKVYGRMQYATALGRTSSAEIRPTPTRRSTPAGRHRHRR